MSETGQESEAPRNEVRGEAAWKAHRQAIAERNDRARAAGKQERQDRERLAAAQRAAHERRTDDALSDKLNARH